MIIIFHFKYITNAMEIQKNSIFFLNEIFIKRKTTLVKKG